MKAKLLPAINPMQQLGNATLTLRVRAMYILATAIDEGESRVA